MKIVKKYNEKCDNLNLVNFKMDNGDFTTIEWNSFAGNNSTMVYVYKTSEEEHKEYKVLIYKDRVLQEG